VPEWLQRGQATPWSRPDVVWRPGCPAGGLRGQIRCGRVEVPRSRVRFCGFASPVVLRPVILPAAHQPGRTIDITFTRGTLAQRTSRPMLPTYFMIVEDGVR
jgi:hypothetical protein